MVDTNRPVAWRIRDRKTDKIVGEFPDHYLAHRKCDELEPSPETSGFRFVVEPVRATDLPIGIRT